MSTTHDESHKFKIQNLLMKKQGEETYNEHSSNRTNWNKHNRFFNYGTYILLACSKKLTVNLSSGVGRNRNWTSPSRSHTCFVFMVLSDWWRYSCGDVSGWSSCRVEWLWIKCQISSLSLKTQELAMQVSLLNQENERMLKALSELTGKDVRDI